MELVTQQLQKTIVQPDHLVRVMDWDNAVLIKRNNTRSIPSDSEIMDEMQHDMQQYKLLSADTVERASDKMIHYYFQYLVAEDNRVRHHFYDGYVKLMTALMQNGLHVANNNLAREIAQDKRMEMDHLLKRLSAKVTEVKGLLLHREVARIYENFRMNHTAYGEHVTPILSLIVNHWGVQFF